MKKNIRRVALASAMGCALLALQACGTTHVSRRISDDGVAGEVIFPDPATQAWRQDGVFPNLDNLRQVGPGMSKDQLDALIGPPHFQEGLVGVREWDYLFRFRSPTGVKTCQYKVIFDKQERAQTFHWSPAACAGSLKPPAERIAERATSEPRTAATPARRSVALSTEVLFAFNGSSRADLLPRGYKALDELAVELRDAPVVERLDFTGHADRLGSSGYNERLSLARAVTVRDYLAQSGVSARSTRVEGRGATEPKVQCRQTDRAALIECLAPNRRVEIGAQAAP